MGVGCQTSSDSGETTSAYIAASVDSRSEAVEPPCVTADHPSSGSAVPSTATSANPNVAPAGTTSANARAANVIDNRRVAPPRSSVYSFAPGTTGGDGVALIVPSGSATVARTSKAGGPKGPSSGTTAGARPSGSGAPGGGVRRSCIRLRERRVREVAAPPRVAFERRRIDPETLGLRTAESASTALGMNRMTGVIPGGSAR